MWIPHKVRANESLSVVASFVACTERPSDQAPRCVSSAQGYITNPPCDRIGAAASASQQDQRSSSIAYDHSGVRWPRHPQGASPGCVGRGQEAANKAQRHPQGGGGESAKVDASSVALQEMSDMKQKEQEVVRIA